MKRQIFTLILLGSAAGAFAQAPAGGRGGGRGGPPPPPPLFFKETWKEAPGNVPVTQDFVTNADLKLTLYPGSNKEDFGVTSEGNVPHIWTGLCASSCALALSHKDSYVDLTGKAKIRWYSKTSGFHEVRPVLKLADGTWLIGDHVDANIFDYHESEFYLSEVRWLKLDMPKVQTKGTLLDKVDLSKVDAIGFADLNSLEAAMERADIPTWPGSKFMESRSSVTMRIKKTPSILVAALAMFTVANVASAQWDPYPWKHVPRTADGKVDFNAPPQRTSYGKIDLSGFWMPENPTKHLLNLAADMKQEEIPLTPWGRGVYNERIANNGKDHPGVSCLPSGIPEKDNIPDGLKIVQTEDLTLVLHESRTIYRQIFTDGRPLPKNPEPTWMGYSIGHWDQDTFVVETIGQNGRTWLDMKGLPGTESLRVTERFTRPKIGHMDIAVTIDDPKAYTKPWDVKMAWRLIPDTDLIESICEENNKDPKHMVGK